MALFRPQDSEFVVQVPVAKLADDCVSSFDMKLYGWRYHVDRGRMHYGSRRLPPVLFAGRGGYQHGSRDFRFTVEPLLNSVGGKGSYWTGTVSPVLHGRVHDSNSKSGRTGSVVHLRIQMKRVARLMPVGGTAFLVLGIALCVAGVLGLGPIAWGFGLVVAYGGATFAGLVFLMADQARPGFEALDAWVARTFPERGSGSG